MIIITVVVVVVVVVVIVVTVIIITVTTITNNNNNHSKNKICYDALNKCLLLVKLTFEDHIFSGGPVAHWRSILD